ncbi:hypothetical protein L3Q82_013423 [Scortum barcoo]|uniref:Uncharacterized protein n=1 Tax=Scortum barcoo TaxID=214431 RepID=A0ACB8W055_9TELE|nr:hypothetical protein L3Q82_013423 [Scortum barcoo]
MFASAALRAALRPTVGALCSAKAWTGGSALLSGPRGGCCVAASFAVAPPVRHYARATRKKKTGPESQLSDLPPTLLKLDYTAVPLAQTTDDIVKRLLSLELASHSEKLQLKKEQLIAKVQRDENDRSSVEVQVAILTARIRNYQEHLQKHHKDKANKRRMLMAIDRRKKLLKELRLVRFDAFEKVCEQLGITYTFPPEYYRRATRRWLAKKALCIKIPKRSHGALGCICPMALSCYTASKYGENCCLGCLPGGLTAMRTHMRLTYGIQAHKLHALVKTASAPTRLRLFPLRHNAQRSDWLCSSWPGNQKRLYQTHRPPVSLSLSLSLFLLATTSNQASFHRFPAFSGELNRANTAMSSRTLPLLFINLGGEMLYILDQRLRAQNIPADKAKKVMNDIITTMFNKKFLEELFKPQELYSKKALRTVFDRLAHASIMRLNQASMDKLYDLMTMAFKYQVLLCPRPKDILLVSFNHMDAIKDFVKDTPSILSQVDETYQQLIEMYTPLSHGDFQLIRQTLLIFFQDMHIRVSIFLKDKVQNSNGRFVLPTSGPVPHGTQVPGLIRMFSCSGEEVARLKFNNGGNYTAALQEGSFEIFGDRVTKLGTNMYSVSRPVETHMSGASKNSAQHTKHIACTEIWQCDPGPDPCSPSFCNVIHSRIVINSSRMYGLRETILCQQVNTAPNPLAKEELNLLAKLMGGLEVQKPGNADSGFRVNLFATDEEEEEALITRPDELSYGVINIQATKDQQANAELAKIMGEFTESGDQSPSASSKGDDLLAMMDGL